MARARTGTSKTRTRETPCCGSKSSTADRDQLGRRPALGRGRAGALLDRQLRPGRAPAGARRTPHHLAAARACRVHCAASGRRRGLLLAVRLPRARFRDRRSHASGPGRAAPIHARASTTARWTARAAFVAGIMDYEERDPLCALYRLDPDGRVTPLDDGIICSNGPCWSLDGRTLYFADTTKRLIYAYDYDDRHGRRSRTAASSWISRRSRFPGLPGRRDGRCRGLPLVLRGLPRPSAPFPARW